MDPCFLPETGLEVDKLEPATFFPLSWTVQLSGKEGQLSTLI